MPVQGGSGSSARGIYRNGCNVEEFAEGGSFDRLVVVGLRGRVYRNPFLSERGAIYCRCNLLSA